ncbi:MAG: PAS domain-containing protein [Williamsia sp.]|nr:PAS domain-containing protein [Williamsia sp.]
MIDNKPKELTATQLKSLKILPAQLMNLLEMRKINAGQEKATLQLEIKNKDLEATKRKLEKSEARLKTLSEGTDVLILMVDPENDLVFLSKAWSGLTGKSLEELLLFGLTELVHPDDKESYLDTYLEAFENRASYSAEFRLQHVSGTYTWLLVQGSPELLEDGSFGGYISSAIDISVLKLALSEPEAANKRFELALDAGKMGAYELNIKSGAMKTKPRYNTNFGLAPDADCNFSSLLSMILPDDRSQVHKTYLDAVKEHRVYETEYRVMLPDSRIRWILSLGLPAYNEAGEAVSVSGISMDVTAQKEAATLPGA